MVADYLNRGRQLSKLQTAVLQERWLDLIRLRYSGGKHDRSMEDVFGELMLRGISHVKLPSDLETKVVEKIEKELKMNSDLHDAILADVFEFAKALRSAKN